jgi:competence protein ComEC
VAGLAEARAGAPSRLLRLGVEAIGVSFCAALGTAPVTAFHFGSVSLVGVLANVAVVPLVGWWALLLGLAGCLLLAALPPLAMQCLSLASLGVRCADRLVLAASRLPGAALNVPRPGAPTAAALCLALLALALPRGRRRQGLLTAAGLLALAAVGCAALTDFGGRGLLRVAFLDVGQGDGAILALPRRGALVFDGGGLGGSLDTGAEVVLPALEAHGIARVDAVVMSHPERDHIGGLATVVEQMPAAEFWSSGARSASETFARLDRALDERLVSRRVVAAGSRVDLARGTGGVEIEALHPPSGSSRLAPNDRSLVLAIRFGATRILLTGDIEAAAEEQILRSGRDAAATILKVPHHGSRTSSTAPWVAGVRPGLAVAMLGRGNRFGFPAPEVPPRYARRGAAWAGTDELGEVDVESDGQLERVATCRPLHDRGDPSRGALAANGS